MCIACLFNFIVKSTAVSLSASSSSMEVMSKSKTNIDSMSDCGREVVVLQERNRGEEAS